MANGPAIKGGLRSRLPEVQAAARAAAARSAAVKCDEFKERDYRLIAVINLNYFGHAGFYLEGKPGDKDRQKLIYDAAGSFRDDIRASGTTVTGEYANFDDYLVYQKKDGRLVYTYTILLTADEDQAIRDRIDEELEGNPSGGVCAIYAGSILNGIGPFKNMGSTVTPLGMLFEMKVVAEEQERILSKCN
jgi:hypothetical protein